MKFEIWAGKLRLPGPRMQYLLSSLKKVSNTYDHPLPFMAF